MAWGAAGKKRGKEYKGRRGYEKRKWGKRRKKMCRGSQSGLYQGTRLDLKERINLKKKSTNYLKFTFEELRRG